MIRVPGHTIHEHRLTVPLVHGGGDSRTIEIFAREVVRDGREDTERLVWFQGGPGGRAQRPESVTGGWLGRALEDHRVLLLDQRGTGRSTPVDRNTLGHLSPEEQAEYLSHLRAPDIVADAEALRAAINDGRPWHVLGQSYGGFVILSYLSLAPEGLASAMITAGLPGADTSADDVYRATFAQTLKRNEEFFQRYPGDRDVARRIALHLAETEEFLPTGERLTPERFQQLGIQLGTASAFDGVHYLLEDPFATVGGRLRLRDTVLSQLSGVLSFAQRPLYAVLHETIYGQPGLAPTAWAAHRIREEFPELAVPATGSDPFAFVGEHIFPWQLRQDPALAPLADAAELLAAKDDWGRLYDPAQLDRNEVPVAAAIYVDDMFVPFETSRVTAERIRGARTFITNDYQHDGIRVDGAHLYERLKGLNTPR